MVCKQLFRYERAAYELQEDGQEMPVSGKSLNIRYSKSVPLPTIL